MCSLTQQWLETTNAKEQIIQAINLLSANGLKIIMSFMNISVGVDRILVTENIESIFVTNHNKDTNTVYSLLTGKALQVDFSTYRDMSVYDLENMDNNESIMLVLFTFGSDKSNTGFIVKKFSTEQYIAVTSTRKSSDIALRGENNLMAYLWRGDSLVNRDKVVADKYEKLLVDKPGDKEIKNLFLGHKDKSLIFTKIKPPVLP